MEKDIFIAGILDMKEIHENEKPSNDTPIRLLCK